ncbi:hypothetical protein ACPXB3_00390 [Gordonia sp. DT219]|uniref:hypothetical protein n=1 Tax=Gordonia sp. DT219 TaxID=3416658 RepID=UPI003CE88FDD
MSAWTTGYRAGIDTLKELPGPMLAAFIPRILAVTPDPDDDEDYDAGYRAALIDSRNGRVVRAARIGDTRHRFPTADLMDAASAGEPATAVCGARGLTTRGPGFECPWCAWS